MKKLLSLLLCAVLLLALLSACGGTASTPESDAPASPSGEEPAPESSAEPVTIHLFHQKQEAQETFAKIIEEFNAEYPYITIEQEIVTNDPSSILKARLSVDEVPDIFQGALDTMDIGSVVQAITALYDCSVSVVQPCEE